MTENLPVLPYNPNINAIIEPHGRRAGKPVPEHCTLYFFPEVIRALKKAARLRRIRRLLSEIGENLLYIPGENGQQVLATYPGVGAPLAVAAVLRL